MIEKLRKYSWSILLFSIFIIPLSFNLLLSDPFKHFQLALFEIVTVFIFTPELIYLLKTNNIWTMKSPLLPSLSLFLFCIIISIGNSINYKISLRHDLEYLTWIIFILILNQFITEHIKLKQILILVLVSSGISAIYGILQKVGIEFISWQFNFQNRSFANFGNPNFLAGQLILTLPISIAYFVDETNRFKK